MFGAVSARFQPAVRRKQQRDKGRVLPWIKRKLIQHRLTGGRNRGKSAPLPAAFKYPKEEASTKNDSKRGLGFTQGPLKNH